MSAVGQAESQSVLLSGAPTAGCQEQRRPCLPAEQQGYARHSIVVRCAVLDLLLERQLTPQASAKGPSDIPPVETQT